MMTSPTLSLTCLHCQKPIAAIDASANVAICPHCQTLNPLTDEVQHLGEDGDVQAINQRLPKTIRLEQHDGQLRLVLSPKHPYLLVVALLMVLPVVFVWISLFVSISNGTYASDQIGIAVLSTGVASLIISLFTYGVLAASLNKRHIMISPQGITRSSKPLPVFDKLTIAAADIDHVYTHERQRQEAKRGQPTMFVMYQVIVRRTDGEDVLLVENLPDPEQGLSVQQAITQTLA